jgi:hypothetical protein
MDWIGYLVAAVFTLVVAADAVFILLDVGLMPKKLQQWYEK